METLNQYEKNVFSQFGEDGIIEYLLSVVPKRGSPLCVEFGAWDGRHLSNTCNLIENHGFQAVLIEGDKDKFNELKENFGKNKLVQSVSEYVTTKGKNSLDSILKRTDVDADFDVLSIDIDGNDYHIWESLKEYTPRIVVIEYNPTIPNHIKFCQDDDFGKKQGASAGALVDLGKKKGYELVACTATNTIFVRKDLFELVPLENNSLEILRPNKDHLTYLFYGYDGEVFIGGNKTMLWHQVPMKSKKFQILPAILRDYPANYSPFQKLIFRVHGLLGR